MDNINVLLSSGLERHQLLAIKDIDYSLHPASQEMCIVFFTSSIEIF